MLAAFHIHDTLQAASGGSDTFDEEDGLDIEIKPRLGLSFERVLESITKAREIFDKLKEVFGDGSTATDTPKPGTGVTDPEDPEESVTKDPEEEGDEDE